MKIKKFKQFLIESEKYIYKPLSGKNKLQWVSEDPFLKVYDLPATQTAVNKAMQEFGSVRMGIDNIGNAYMWNAGALHDVFWNQYKHLKPSFNLIYHKRQQFIKGTTSSYEKIDIEKLQQQLQKNPGLIGKAFQQIHDTFPEVIGIKFDISKDILSLTPPYEIFNES